MARFSAHYKVSFHRGTRIREIRKGDCYQVDFTAHGDQLRRRFATIAQAKTWIDQKAIEVENKGRGAFDLNDRDRLDVAEARKWLHADTPLATVFAYWKERHPEGEQKTVGQLAELFLTDRGMRGKKSIERREHTTGNHEKRLRRFREAFGGRPAHEVATADIVTFLDANGWQGLNRRHYVASIRAFFAYGVRKGFLTINPALEIELPDVKPADPVILTPAEVERYLRAIETAKATRNNYVVECSCLLPREAIAFFCGLRPEELSRLDWKHVSLENKLITVGADVAKIQGHKRTVEMPDNLVHWLRPYARPSGPVWPHTSATTLVRYRAWARKASGVDVPDNAGRHAFASYHLALHENSATTAERLGHSDVKLLRTVYRNIVASDGRPITKASGEAYFQIAPKRENETTKPIFFQVAG